MRRLISACLGFLIKLISLSLYRTKVGWVGGPEPKHAWKDLRLFVFLHHTSLYEPLFASAFPFLFIWEASNRIVIPGADKTLNRPVVGSFFKLLLPRMVAITRRRDFTWDHFLDEIDQDCMVVIFPEGRMMRLSGLDTSGQPMSVRGGIADILRSLKTGKMMIAYSGGLHHVQAPGQFFPRLFKTLKINFEVLDIAEYIAGLAGAQKDGSAAGRSVGRCTGDNVGVGAGTGVGDSVGDSADKSFKVRVIQDLEERIVRNCPPSPTLELYKAHRPKRN